MGVKVPEVSTRAPAVRRALRLLDALAFERRARPVDLARAVGLAKSSASDLIGTLLEERMLAREGDDLVLGGFFAEIAAGFVGDVTTTRDFVLAWERSMVLREHTVTLQTLIGSHNVCVAVCLGTHVLPYTPRAGSRLPLWTAAGPEPVLMVVPRGDLRRSLERFPDSSSTGEALHAWVQARPSSCPTQERPGARDARAAQDAVLSSTGNLEFTTQVSAGRDRVGPVVVTVHVIPNSAVRSASVQAALDDFATELRGVARTR